ncbi:MAG: hypothetical protein QGG74_01045 [Phycisphaerales bacterium]|nr:hypothetical protein [Phycisphaerales bacterium]
MHASTIRPYAPDRDRAHCLRIMEEIGWGLGEEKENGPLFDSYISECDVLVAELNGEAESFAVCRDGSMRYLDEDVSVGFITGVGTGRIARGRGLALTTTGAAVERAARGGAALARLGVFDQGFYDRLGFGSLGYMRSSTVDPRKLRVPKLARPPRRLTSDDADAMHACRRRRMRWHGACNLDGVGATHCEMLWEKTRFGLGFNDETGRLTHCMLVKPNGENGPYRVDWMAYENPDQFIELLSVLKSLGDQIHGVSMMDPPHVQMQDMLETPFLTLRSRDGGAFDVKPRSNAWEQIRILDLDACIAPVQLPGDGVRCTLHLDDPITEWLPADAAWKGLTGSYVLTLGPTSSIEPGSDHAFPTLTASVGALTRLWIGARPAASLVISDSFECQPELAAAIDGVMRLPAPISDWDA